MDQGHKAKKEAHPKESANIFSLLSFFYTRKLFLKGYRQNLTETDLYEVLKTCQSKKLGDRLEEKWQLHKKIYKHPSIVRVLWACFGKTYMLLGLMQLCMRTIFVLVIPEALGKLVSYFTPGQTSLTKTDAYCYAAAVIGFNIINFVYTQNYQITITEYGIRIRTAICSLIYRKTLKMTEASLSEITMGKIITLITKDMFAIEMLILFGNDIWIGLIQTVLICYLIYAKIGVSAFAGVGFFLTVLPIQILIGKMSSVFRLKTSKKTDERLQLTQEVLSSVKIIKMYAWEKFFIDRITTARRKEVNSIYKLSFLKVIIIVIGGLSSKIAFYLLIMTYVWLGNNITAELVYFIMSCFGKLRHLLSILLPLGITFGAEVNATIIRLNTLLDSEELPFPRPNIDLTGNKEPKIVLNNITIKIKKAEIFKNTSITLNKGLNILVGHIGSGKSTFLKTLLQNYTIEGDLTIYGKISYASQEPWLFPSTIKQNILFGEKYQEERYKKVLYVCALNEDLSSFELGDETIVGDRGINLSKGQQARVNLARAVYQNCDIYLLDDCLSSLDGRVSDFVFKECITGLLRDKLCIFVTNNEDYLKGADKIIEITKGKIKVCENNEIDKEKINLEVKQDETTQEQTTDEEIVKETSTELMYQEKKKEGKVDIEIYKKYMGFGGGFLVFSVIILMFAGAQTAVSYSDKLVSQWVTVEQNISSYKTNNLTETTEYFNITEKRTNILHFYTIMIATSTLMAILKEISFYLFNRRAGIKLHAVMLLKIIGAKMTFFDQHFLGNILNRFSKDLSTIDEHLPFVMSICFEKLFIILGVVFLVSTVHAMFLIPIAVFFLLAFLVRHVYQPTGRSLKRLEASTRGPLIGHLNASIDGLATIRAFNAQEMIKNEFDKHQDLYTSASYNLHSTMRALGFVLDGMCAVFIAMVIGRFLLVPMDTTVGNVGLAISQAFTLTGLLQYGIRRWSDFENHMTSVERVLEYTDIDQEKPEGVKLERLNEGKIVYENVSLTYNDNRKILKNINLKIEGQEKIGIVGRTGAGKSSIISTLFRLYDIKGKILIDGIDIQTLALNFLRSQISIIPQDPIIFSGTIRQNIDPLNQYQDEDIWKAVKITGLETIINNLSLSIDNITNFSSGQKQLLCLVRALVRKNKIVVLDEATSNLDPETDSVIRMAIEKNFSSCTVIMIAHRLVSVLTSGVVIVLKDGQIVEKDDPNRLLTDKNSLFFQMLKTK